jgi:hypothetical protein
VAEELEPGAEGPGLPPLGPPTGWVMRRRARNRRASVLRTTHVFAEWQTQNRPRWSYKNKTDEKKPSADKNHLCQLTNDSNSPEINALPNITEIVSDSVPVLGPKHKMLCIRPADYSAENLWPNRTNRLMLTSLERQWPRRV